MDFVILISERNVFLTHGQERFLFLSSAPQTNKDYDRKHTDTI